MNQGNRRWRGMALFSAPALAALGAMLMLPGAARLSGRQRTSLDGIVTIQDAIDACRGSGLCSWDLVAYAQRLVARKFSVYTVWNLWDTPARAFAFGMGYCTQYNLALKEILEGLAFEVQAVSSRQVAVFDKPDWTLGHTWLRVQLDGVTRDVCAGRVENAPGRMGFTPLKPVWRGNDLIFVLTHLGMILFVGSMGWRAWLSGRPAPGWTYAPRA